MSSAQQMQQDTHNFTEVSYTYGMNVSIIRANYMPVKGK
jgi:hypothetical protein